MVNGQSTQIELLMWGCIFCLIAAVCMLLSDNFDRKKRKWLFLMQFFTALLLFNDALAYVFRGYPGQTGRVMVYLSNFLVFFISDVVMFFFNAYVCSYLFQNGKQKKTIREQSVSVICIVGMCLVVVSQFTNLYYYFDADNFYHRNDAYIISFLIPVTGMLIDLSLLIEYRKNVSRKIFVSLLSYIVLPLLAAIIQIFYYGLSFINISIAISIAISMIIMYVAATSELNGEMYRVLKKKAEVEERLEIATTLNRCVTELSAERDVYDAIHNLLGVIDDYFKGDRSYIFEINEDGKTINNTHEYVREGVTDQKDNLQEVPIEVISVWMDSFQKNEVYYIDTLEKERGRESYEMLQEQDVQRLLAVPLRKEGKIIGFLGVDNPRMHYDDATLLSSIQYFITNSLDAKRHQEQLQYLSYRDMLTKLYNRNKYMDVLRECEAQTIEKTGVAYIDLNGLKKINDGQGHDAGDRFIRQAAGVISAIFSDDSYRVGGDEFVIICRDIEEASFAQKVQEMDTRMKQEKVSVSVGTLWKEKDSSLSDMLREADRRMYEEKERYHDMERRSL